MATPSDPLLTDRDAEALLALTRFRLLSYAQLTRLTYRDVHKTVARRRMRRLAAGGWVELWQKPTSRGGSPTFVYPSKRTMQWAADRTAADIAGTPIERLVELMTPETPRAPWDVHRGAAPLFLTHTEQVNDLVIVWTRSAAVRWASSWDCPFPEHVEWRGLPQPDYVLVVEDAAGRLHLVFGEHDRSTEGTKQVAAAFRTYQTWAEHPALAEATFGFATFHVLVTVDGPSPLRRIAKLATAVREEGATAFTRLTLGSWAAPDPTAAVWFDPMRPPTTNELVPAAHALSGPLPFLSRHA